MNALQHSPWIISTQGSGYLKRFGFNLSDSQLETRHNTTDYARTIPNFPFIYITTKSLLVDWLTGNSSNYTSGILYGTDPFNFYFTVGKNQDFGDPHNADDDILCEQLDIIIEIDNQTASPYQGSLSVVNLHET